jgi:hypothetical protein
MVAQRINYLAQRNAERRKKKQILIVSAVVGAVVFFVGGAIWLSRIDALQIKTITVEGAGSALKKNIQTVADEELEKKIWFVFPRRNTLLFSKSAIEKRLLTEPKIKTVEIDRFGFSEIKIIITERAPFALWCEKFVEQKAATAIKVETKPESVSDCYFVDNEGFIYARAPFFSGHVFFELYGGPLLYDVEKKPEENIEASSSRSILDIATSSFDIQKVTPAEIRDVIGTQYIPRKDFLISMDLVNSLKKEGIQVHSLFVFDRTLFELKLATGGMIRFSPAEDLAKAIESLIVAWDKKFTPGAKITPTKLEYVDIRFDNKVLFKFK